MLRKKIIESIMAIRSQSQIIDRLIVNRAQTRVRAGIGLELYLSLDPRLSLDYAPYHTLVAEISTN